jgi:hypothetical protein
MSSIFQEGDVGLGADTLETGKVKAAEAVAKLKDKREETARTVEEGLASLKVMIGGKGVSKAFLEDPLVKKYAGQLKKKAADAVKDVAKRAMTKVQDSLSQATRGAVGDNPAAIASRMGGQTAQNAGTSQAEAASNQATAEVSEDSAKYQEARAAEQNFGRSEDEQFDDWDAPPAYEAEEGLSNTSSTALTTAAESNVPEVDVASFFTSGAPSTTTPIFDAGAAAARDAASAARTAALAGGEDAAVGGGEALLSGLDAIPGLDIFTLLAGAGLGIGAAAKKRVKATPVMPPPPQAHVAFQAGFDQV